MDSKPLIRSKAFWVNAATFAVGVLTLFSSQFGAELSPTVSGIILSALGLLNIFLRVTTTTQIGGVLKA